MKKEYTQRWFYIYNFKDNNWEKCSLQQSSSFDTKLWLGVNDNRMHIDVDLAGKIILLLEEFIKETDYNLLK